MDGFSPFWFALTFILLLWNAIKNEKEKPYDDDDVDDYWTDG